MKSEDRTTAWLTTRRGELVAARDALERAAALGHLGTMTVADQLDHALGFVWAVETRLGRSPVSVLDLGTGGGPPGLVLAACWPMARTLLVEANARRAEYLQTTLGDLGMTSRARVLTGRAEVLGREPDLREAFEAATARSFGRPSVTAECSSPFLVVGGLLVVSEPPEARRDERWPAGPLGDLGLARSQRVRFAGRFGFQVLEKVAAVNARYPRRTGVPGRRPLF